jgi:hypothetical protein
MIDEHQGQCIYENGRFRLREETDYAIIDELEDFPPIMVQMEETDDGSESQYADRRGVLHLMNQLADTNPNEQRHFYLKYRLDKLYADNDLLRKENEQLKSALKELKEIGDYQTNHIKELQEELQPIQDICKKYKIPLEDLPDVLEEYITLDNEEYEEKTKRENNMKRYTRLNEYYILDNYTGQKLNQNNAIRRLNKYETILQEIKKNERIE